MKRKLPADLSTLLGVITVLFCGGLGLILLSCLLVSVFPIPEAVGGGLLFLGVCVLVSSLVLAYSRIRCPYCGGSLMLRGRLPSSLPRFCPHCGKPLQ